MRKLVLVDKSEEITVEDLTQIITNTSFIQQCCIAINNINENQIKLCWLDGWHWINLSSCSSSINFSVKIKTQHELKQIILTKLKEGYDIYFFDSYQEYLDKAKSITIKKGE